MDNMEDLVKKLNEASYKYYAQDEPAISDDEWDEMYERLKALEAETGRVLPDSPTRRVGAEPLAKFAPHTHLFRLWSLNKVRSEEAVAEWAARIERAYGERAEYAVEYKFDGLTINLTYENGELVQAATRGNGVIGEEILSQARTIRSIPLAVPYKGRFEAHGECYMRLSVLDAYNKTAAEPLKNARNGAAGALRNLDPAVTAARKLDAAFYNVGYIEGLEFSSHREMREFMIAQRLPVSERVAYAKSVTSVMSAIREIDEEREKLDFMIDGAVVKVVDFALRRELGYTEKFPHWAVAYKFKSEETVATLEDVVWEPGRTGKLTPTAILSPVEIGGATVRRATLNNYQDIVKKDVAIGARVWLRRSNEVIPEIMGRAGERGEAEREIARPEFCPSCGAAVEERGAHIFCPNRDGCKRQIIARLSHFAGREAMDIEGFSDKTAERLFGDLGVAECWQLYSLTAEELTSLEGFKDKKAENLVSAIAESKTRPLDQFIFALGIPNVGRKTARDLAARFASFEALRRATVEELTAIDDVGGIVADSIIEFFQDAANTQNVDKLFAAGVTPSWEARAAGGAFEGLTVVITGNLESMTRIEAQAAVRNAGGKATESVSKKTSLVVAGPGAGSKLDKARQLGVEVISEEEFVKKLKSL